MKAAKAKANKESILLTKTICSASKNTVFQREKQAVCRSHRQVEKKIKLTEKFQFSADFHCFVNKSEHLTFTSEKGNVEKIKQDILKTKKRVY